MNTGLPADFRQQAVAVIGAGTLGRRIAAVFINGGYEVHLHDQSQEALDSAQSFITENIEHFPQLEHISTPGKLLVYTELPAALQNVWLVIEAIPEQLESKISLFQQLENLVTPEVLLATNSSSYKSSEMSAGLKYPERMFNMHFGMPPVSMSVELMTNGVTKKNILEALQPELEKIGLVVGIALAESTGFIINRIWAAMKREALMVLEEKIASVQDIDNLMKEMFGTPVGPFQMMDSIGLDVVKDIEAHYLQERSYLPDSALQCVSRYVEDNKLGVKTGEGFYKYS